MVEKNSKNQYIIDINGRIDKIVAQLLAISRNKAQEIINNGFVLVNNNVVNKTNFNLNVNDVIEIKKNAKENVEKYIDQKIKPYEAKLDIIYEDEYFLVINKPSNCLTHPTIYNEPDTLLNICLYYFKKNKIEHDPWIVHRLDKYTSGLIIIAKGLDALNKLQEIFYQRNVIKKYYAIVNNCFYEQKIIIDVPIARSSQNKLKMNTINGKNPKDAKTGVELIQNYNNHALVSCELFTGRTHQIRVHLRHINHPILNDPLYGSQIIDEKYGQFLHSYFLSFTHPFTNKKIELNLPMPNEFIEVIKKLNNNQF